MSFAQGCLLSRAAILTNLLHVPEQEVLEQRLGSERVNKGGSRRSDAGGSAAGLDLDRERPWWASHQHFGVNGRDKSSPACVGSMIWASPCGVEGSVRNPSTPGGWYGR